MKSRVRTCRHRRFFLVLWMSVACGVSACKTHYSIQNIYLTWDQPDTSTSMVVVYHTSKKAQVSQVFYDLQSHGGDPTQYRFHAVGHSEQIPRTDSYVHRVRLTGLEPGVPYYVIAGDPSEPKKMSREIKFRTLPTTTDAPLRFVTGGDFGTDSHARTGMRFAAEQYPQLALLGGDLAYAQENSPFAVEEWSIWFDHWSQTMTTPDGFSIPLISAIGNHETNLLDEGPRERAPHFVRFFPQDPEKTYFTRKLGAHAVVYVLDSGHVFTHEAQTAWLKKQMKTHRTIPHRFAIYHVPLYPSVRSFDYNLSQEGRTHWAPLFDQFQLTAAFENHDHAVKRTQPLRGGKPSVQGTVYFGDGCWGKGPRAVSKREYLDFALAERHVWIVDVTREQVEYHAVSHSGTALDRYTQTAVRR